MASTKKHGSRANSKESHAVEAQQQQPPAGTTGLSAPLSKIYIQEPVTVKYTNDFEMNYELGGIVKRGLDFNGS